MNEPVSLLLVWFILFFLFVWLHFMKLDRQSKFFTLVFNSLLLVLLPSTFVVPSNRVHTVSSTCVYHLLCICAVAAFLNTLGVQVSDTFVFCAPITIQLGIFLAVGLQECALALGSRFRTLLLSLLDALQLLMLAALEGLRQLLAEIGGEQLPT